MGKLTGKTAIITGATSGIGRATTLLFADEGANLVLTGRRLGLGKTVEVECRQREVRSLFVQADHIRSEDWSRVVESALQAFGHIHILFNRNRSKYYGQKHLACHHSTRCHPGAST